MAADKLIDLFGRERKEGFGLDSIRAACREIGHPEQATPTLLLGGTNGKGSTAYYLSALLHQQGKKVHTYLSPHLEHPRERFLENLKPLSREDFDELVERLIPVGKKWNLTYFEFLTLCQFVRSAQAKPDFLILEAGLGGRLDATNIVPHPLATILTNISKDHQQYLGNSLAEILGEKMGLLREHTPCFSQISTDPLKSQLASRCEQLSAPLHLLRQEDVLTHTQNFTQIIDFRGRRWSLTHPGAHFALNSALAVLVHSTLFGALDDHDIQGAFGELRLPGRMEKIDWEGKRLFFSGDHNEAGLECLFQMIEATGCPPHSVLAAFSPDKDYKVFIPRLRSHFEHCFITQSHWNRSLTPQDYWDLATHAGEIETVFEAFMASIPPGGIGLVTGSFYLIGEVKQYLNAKARRVI